MSNNPSDKSKNRDNKVVALLDILGQRMLDSESERLEIREKIEDIDSKTDNSERAFIALQNKINKSEATNKALSQRQKDIESKLEDQLEKIEKAYAMTEKLEEAMAQQARINRRLDKIVQDKTRMIGKLDRIEETVIETQEALHANAMIMLTGNGEDEGPQIPVDMKKNHGLDNDEDERTWWHRAFSVQNAGIAGMVGLAIFCGWGLSQISYTELASSGQSDQNLTVAETSIPAADEEKPTFDEVLAAIEPATGTDENTATADIHDHAEVEDNGMGVFENNSDAELIAQMNEDADALAAQLNEIVVSAGATPPEDMQKSVNEAAPVQTEEKITKAALPAANAVQSSAKEPNVSEFIAQHSAKGALRERITSDAGLPDVIKLIEDKAFEGIAEAQHDLAAIYTAGHGGVETDYAKAATWFREAAVNGVANARYNLGVLYHQGLGVEQNIDTAFGWYRAAAKAGHPEAQYNLGIAYIEGIGTPYDPAKAAMNFENAAKSGILEAAYNLGLIHENGLLGTAKPGEALKWYKLAADLGSAEGQAALDQLAKIMEIDPETVQAYSLTPQKSGSNTSTNLNPDQVEKKQSSVAPRNINPVQQNDNKTAELSVGTLRPEDIMHDIDSSAESAESIIETFPTLPASALTDVSDHLLKDQAIVAQVQEQLMRVGLYPGPADGVSGPMTDDAIKSYQAMYDLPQNGKASEALLVHMLAGELGSSLPQYGSRED